jgi:cell division protein ZapA (FtsZ GTPase activity inhibitor)
LEQIVTIELFGRTYTVKAESEIVQASEVADFLVKEVDRVQAKFSDPGGISEMVVLILAALNIANENLELHRSCGEIMNRLSIQSAAILDKLEESAL